MCVCVWVYVYVCISVGQWCETHLCLYIHPEHKRFGSLSAAHSSSRSRTQERGSRRFSIWEIETDILASHAANAQSLRVKPQWDAIVCNLRMHISQPSVDRNYSINALTKEFLLWKQTTIEQSPLTIDRMSIVSYLRTMIGATHKTNPICAWRRLDINKKKTIHLSEENADRVEEEHWPFYAHFKSFCSITTCRWLYVELC